MKTITQKPTPKGHRPTTKAKSEYSLATKPSHQELTKLLAAFTPPDGNPKYTVIASNP